MVKFRGRSDLLAAGLDDFAIRTLSPVLQDDIANRVRSAKAWFMRGVAGRFTSVFPRLRGYMNLTRDEDDLWYILTLVCCSSFCFFLFPFLRFISVIWCGFFRVSFLRPFWFASFSVFLLCFLLLFCFELRVIVSYAVFMCELFREFVFYALYMSAQLLLLYLLALCL